MKTIIGLFLVLGLAGGAMGAFTDDFSYVMGTDLVGQGGWVTNYNANGSAMPSLVQSDIKVYDGHGWNDGAYVLGGAARDVSGDVVGGKYEMTVTLHGQEYAYGSVLLLTIGDSGITDGGTSNHLTLYYDANQNKLYYYRHINGIYEYAGALETSRNMESYMQHQLKVTVDLNANAASVYFRDVDNVTLAPIEPWNLEGSWNYDLPMTTITQAGIASSNYKYIYDFNSVPEPATMSILGLGGLLAVVRRRK